MKEKVLIVGLGEVGCALFELFKESRKFDVYGFDVDKEKMRKIVSQQRLPGTVAVMHICYPCYEQGRFVQTTLDYIRKFKPKLTVIESTVPPGTTQRIYDASKKLIAHSPIRGMHKGPKTMKQYIKPLTKYVGGKTSESAQLAREHFEKLGLKVNVLKSSMETELAKLFETTYRAWMIVCFQEMHRISRRFGADFNEIVSLLEDTHRARLDRPVMFPDVISGHCLIENAQLLLKSYDSECIRLILKSNEKRKEEIRAKQVLEEVEKIKKKAKALQKELMNKFGEKSLPY